MDTMARATAYGGIPPEQFLGMSYEDAAELARRVTLLHFEEWEDTQRAADARHEQMMKMLTKQAG
jgi:hypothetical protein